MNNIRVGDLQLGEEEKAAINAVLDSGRISEGPRVAEFERQWADYIGTKYCVAVSSGTAALITGLTALKIKYNLPVGTQVITSPLTFIADANAIVVTGFEPVFVDINPSTFVITPEAVEQYLSTHPDNNCRIILPVDLMGYSVDIDKFTSLAEKYNLLFFEDASEAHGTLHNSYVAGSQSLLSAYSFYIAHNVQAGELGALVTNDESLVRLFRKVKTNGRACDCVICTRSQGVCPLLDNYEGEDDFDPRFTHDVIGYNFKTMEFQAALALVQLKKADWIIKKRQENIFNLNQLLSKYSGILQLPEFSPMVSYLAYPLVIKDSSIISRKDLRAGLKNAGVESRPLFGCIPNQQPAYAYLKEEYQGKLPQADYAGENGFYIGCHQYLTEEDLERVGAAFDKALGSLSARVSFPVLKRGEVEVPKVARTLPPRVEAPLSVPKGKVLVTGGGGYIGSTLVGQLLNQGYQVRVVDVLLHGEEPLQQYQGNSNFDLVMGDIRDSDVIRKGVGGVEAVVHLAALGGASESRLFARTTWQVNYDATVELVKQVKQEGVRRFIFASACNIYQVAGNPFDWVTEESQTYIDSPYASSKSSAEKYLLANASAAFNPTVARLATVFGTSPRMRFDISINNLVREAYCRKLISASRSKRESHLSVADAVRALVLLLEASVDDVSGEIFNVGAEQLHFSEDQLAQLVADRVPGTEVVLEGDVGQGGKVSFEKLKRTLGYQAKSVIKEGVTEVFAYLQNEQSDPYQDRFSNARVYSSLRDAEDTRVAVV